MASKFVSGAKKAIAFGKCIPRMKGNIPTKISRSLRLLKLKRLRTDKDRKVSINLVKMIKEHKRKNLELETRLSVTEPHSAEAKTLKCRISGHEHTIDEAKAMLKELGKIKLKE